MAEEFFWVVHILGGTRRLDGPYKQRSSAELRASRIHGGEVHVMRTWTPNAAEADSEFAAAAAEA